MIQIKNNIKALQNAVITKGTKEQKEIWKAKIKELEEKLNPPKKKKKEDK